MRFSGTNFCYHFEWNTYAWVDTEVFELSPEEYRNPDSLLEALIRNPRFNCNYLGMAKGTSIGFHSAFLIPSMNASSYKQITEVEAKELISDFPRHPDFKTDPPTEGPIYEPDDLEWLNLIIFPQLQKSTSIFHLVKDRVKVDPSLDGFQATLVELVIINSDSLWLVVFTDD